MAVSDDLRRAITGSDKTVYAIAKESGVSPQVLGRFIRNERGINIDTVDRLAAYFRLRLARDDAKPRRKKKAAG